MHDIRQIREEPDAFDRALARRGLGPIAARVLELDGRRRAAQVELQDLQTRRNAISKEIGVLKREGQPADHLTAEVSSIKDRMSALESIDRSTADEVHMLLSQLPNLPATDVPDGADETANVETSSWGEPRRIEGAREHFELGEASGQMDFERAARMSGARFVVLKSELARLERALGQFMIDLHVQEHGYVEVSPPLLVRDDALFGTGQLPKFADQQFRTTTDHWLIPTAEVSLTNLVAGEILDHADLPLRFTALTACFRSEAGAAGRDTRGMLRQHQFYKVELVSITDDASSDEEQARMTACAEEVLRRLGLTYRVVKLSTGDMGFSARRTFDIEVWLPGQKAYREISSCSSCGDFQARRMNSRYRSPEGKGTHFVHTLNGSGVAVGRALIAVMETYQQADGSIVVPDVLRPYMSGIDKIGG